MENGREHYSERLDRIEGIIEATASRHGEIEDESEATDKINALVSLMDQHLHDHGNKSCQGFSRRLYGCGNTVAGRFKLGRRRRIPQ